MAENPIRKEDIIDGDAIQKELKQTEDGLIDLIDKMQQFVLTSAAAKKATVEGLNPALKEDQKVLDAVSKEINSLIKTSTTLARTRDQLTKASQQNAKVLKVETGSYFDLNQKLKDLEKQAKSTGDEGFRKKLIPQIESLKNNLKSLDAQMGNHQRNVGNYKQAIIDVGKKFLALTGITVGVQQALKFVGDAFNSTGASGDKLEEMTEGVKQGFDAIKRAVVNLDFKDFIKNVKDAYDEGARYARGLDEVDERTRALQVAEAETSKAILEQIIISRSANYTKAQQIAAGKKVIELEESLAKIRTGIADRAFQNEIDNVVQITGLHADEVFALLKMNDAMLKNIETGKRYNEFLALNDKYLQSLGGKTGMSAFSKEQVDNLMAMRVEFANVTEETKRFARAAENLATDDKMQILTDKYVALKSAETSALQATMRISTQVDSKEAKLEGDKNKRADDTLKTFEMNGLTEIAGIEKVTFKKIESGLRWSKSVKQQNDAIIKSNEEVAKSQEETISQQINNTMAYVSIAGDAANALSDILQARKEKELSAVGDNAEARLKIEKEYARKEKALAITQAIISTSLAVLNALNTKPYLPLGPIMAASAAALGAVQIGIIASQKFAEGGYTGDGSGRDETGERVAGVVHEREYVISKEPTRKYRSLLEAINADNPMAIAEELRGRKFHQVWGGVQPKLEMAQRQDPYTMLMYNLMKNSVTTYEDSNGDTVLRFADGSTRVIKK